MIFDTHTHYDDAAYDADREEVLRLIHAGGVGLICNIGADLGSSRASACLAAEHDFMYAAVGTHPDETGDMDEAALAEIKELAADKKVVAIGEIGLDYHGFDRFTGKPGKETQRHWFQRQLDVACELGLPVVVHSRNAGQETLEMMTGAVGNGLKKAVIHCYSYSAEMAERYVQMGFYIGVGGAVTYEGHKKLIRALDAVPPERILLETDCPYMTPAPARVVPRGTEEPSGAAGIFAGASTAGPAGRNISTYLSFVRDRVAEIKGISPAELEEITFGNGREFYGV